MSAGRLSSQACVENGLILRCERCLLSETARLTGVPLRAADPDPLAREVGVFGFVMSASAANRHRQRCCGNDRPDRISIKHRVLPVIVVRAKGATRAPQSAVASAFRCRRKSISLEERHLRGILAIPFVPQGYGKVTRSHPPEKEGLCCLARWA